jgi:hypothetical protein
MMICARTFGKRIIGVHSRNVQELTKVEAEGFAFLRNTTRQVMTSEGLLALLGCASISGKDERSCGCKQEDKQKEKQCTTNLTEKYFKMYNEGA